MKSKYCESKCRHMQKVVDKSKVILFYCSAFAHEPDGRVIRLACDNGKTPYRIMRCRGDKK